MKENDVVYIKLEIPDANITTIEKHTIKEIDEKGFLTFKEITHKKFNENEVYTNVASLAKILNAENDIIPDNVPIKQDILKEIVNTSKYVFTWFGYGTFAESTIPISNIYISKGIRWAVGKVNDYEAIIIVEKSFV